MIMGWKNPHGETPYFFGKVNSVDRKFIRVITSVILPISGRQRGVVIVMAESYRPGTPMDLIALAAKAGPWKVIEDSLVKYRRDLKFDHIVTDSEESRHLIRRIPGLSYGQIPMLICTAPKTAFTEAGRQRVDSLVDQGRLHLDAIKHVLDVEGELGLRALAAVVAWGSEHPAFYRKASSKQPEGTPLGTVGL